MRFKAHLLFGVAVSLLNLSMAVLPLYVINSSCLVSALFYDWCGIPVYISVFETLALFYAPLMIASTIALAVYVARVAGYIACDSVTVRLTPFLLLLSSIMFSHLNSSMGTRLFLSSLVKTNTMVHVEIELSRTLLGYYASYWGPFILALVLLVAEVATALTGNTTCGATGQVGGGTQTPV